MEDLSLESSIAQGDLGKFFLDFNFGDMEIYGWRRACVTVKNDVSNLVDLSDMTLVYFLSVIMGHIDSFHQNFKWKFSAVIN
jgi:hypothetical protein